MESLLWFTPLTFFFFVLHQSWSSRFGACKPSEMVLTHSDLNRLMPPSCLQLLPALTSRCSPHPLDVTAEVWSLLSSAALLRRCCGAAGGREWCLCACFLFFSLSLVVMMNTQGRIKVRLEVDFSGEQTLPACRFFLSSSSQRHFLQVWKFIPVFCVAVCVGVPLA